MANHSEKRRGAGRLPELPNVTEFSFPPFTLFSRLLTKTGQDFAARSCESCVLRHGTDSYVSGACVLGIAEVVNSASEV